MANYKINIPVRVTKADRRLVFGFANVAVEASGEQVVDTHDEVIDADVLEKAAYNYVIKHRGGGVEHEVMGVASLVESCFLTAEKFVAMGVDPGDFKGAAWWIGFRVDDADVWEAVKSGELAAFSIGGRCERVEID